MAPTAGLVVVIGAGPAGAATAHILAARGSAVLLVDDGRGSVDRIEMLPPAAIVAFAAVGFGPLLDDPSIASPCLGVLRGSLREDFIARPGGRGFTVHRPTFDTALRSAAAAVGAEFRVGRLVAAVTTADGVELTIAGRSSRERLRAQAVIDASGRSAAVARRLGGRLSTFERLIAQRVGAPPATGPWLTFAPDPEGWRYAISGPNGMVDAWRVSAKALRGASAVDASARVLEPAAGPRWIAVGDASAAFDPICCQGLAHAAGTAVVAARLILDGGTVAPEPAERYNVACRETARATEMGRRAVYAGLALQDTEEGVVAAASMCSDQAARQGRTPQVAPAMSASSRRDSDRRSHGIAAACS